MPCYHPIPAWWAKRKNENGKRSIVFRVDEGFADKKIEVPCGRCLGCKLEYSRQWAVRCMHEAKMHETSVFVTLTYRPEDLPANGSLRPDDYVKFMKRLRHAKPGVRFFQCGEYGENLSRPHHHAILFNCWFSDRRFLKSKDGIDLYTSKELDEIWGFGSCTIGAVTFESAAYVARYAVKKVHGGAEAHYAGRLAEYCTMSRRPGIGATFVEKYRRDIYPSDECVVRGVPTRPPRYYDNVVEKVAPSVVSRVKSKRRARMAECIAKAGVESEYSDAVAGELVNARKLKVREVVKAAAVSHLTREVERAP